MLINAAADERMVDEARLLAERANEAGVEARLKVFDGVWHACYRQDTSGTWVRTEAYEEAIREGILPGRP